MRGRVLDKLNYERDFVAAFQYGVRPLTYKKSRVEQVYKFIGAKETVDTREEFKHLNINVATNSLFCKAIWPL